MPKLSVIIPTFNEINNPYLLKILAQYKMYSELKVIASDGGSTDGTLELLRDYDVQVIESNTNSRAMRMNFGVQNAAKGMVLFNHPRSIISKEGIEYLLENAKKLNWGGFSHQFDESHWLLKFTSWYSNKVRAKRGIIYLDHCIFLQKDMFDIIGELPDVDIFEDTILSYQLTQEFGKPQILPFVSKTSAIRFKNNGIIRHSLENQILKIKYYLGFDLKKMNKSYEKVTKLNSQYKD